MDINALSLQVKRKYRGNHRRVVNLVRATGVFDDPGDILRALEALREHSDLKIARVKGARTGTCHPRHICFPLTKSFPQLRSYELPIHGQSVFAAQRET